jgi:hypothetical protein
MAGLFAIDEVRPSPGLSILPFVLDPLLEQQHYIFPVFRGVLPYGLEYNVGAGFGLTRGSDQVLVKYNIELEHFISALF